MSCHGMSSGRNRSASRLSVPAPYSGACRMARKNTCTCCACSTCNRKQGPDLDLSECLLPRFSGGSLLQGLTVFHEPGGNGPKAPARLDAATAQTNPSVVLGNAAPDQARILIVNGSARVADVAGDVVARGDAQLDFRATLIAEVHEVLTIRARAAVVDSEERFPELPEAFAQALEGGAPAPLRQIDRLRVAQVLVEIGGELFAGFLAQHHRVQLVVEQHTAMVKVG